MAAYSFHISFYAVALRGDDVEAALQQLAPITARYGASHWAVYRSADDMYKFLLTADFADKGDFQKFWYGDEAQDFRVAMQGSYQNPILYVAHTIAVEGSAVTANA
ncbi:MAG: hypothetical protein REI11_21610 [Patulibacter sp.]|nr:hypothetical protein [Patulibacter sp.]